MGKCGIYLEEEINNIPWKCIKKIGDDIILIESSLEELLQEC